MVNFELYDPEKHDLGTPPEDIDDSDVYEDGCEECGGKVWSTGGHGYYNGSYQCYTMYLECENCGPYEVECV